MWSFWRRGLEGREQQTAVGLPVLPPEAGADGPLPAHPGLALLVSLGKLDAATARAVEHAAEIRGEPVPVVLRQLGRLDERAWVELLVGHYDFRAATAADVPEAPLCEAELTPTFQRHNRILPLAIEGGQLWLGMADPTDTHLIGAVAVATGLSVVPVAMALEVIEAAHARYWDQGAGAVARILGDAALAEGEADESAEDEAKTAPVVRLVDQILAEAVRLGASDVHIEPTAQHLRVRYRLHGRLGELATPPAALARAVVSRIKILARLDVAERRLPQDGRVRLTIAGREIDLRVATMPTIHGESAVLRILDQSRGRVELSGLGMPLEIERRLIRLLDSPYGMILVTGPTGSGKTTTLYAALDRLDRRSRKLISIEDPVEYQLDGVTQIPVRPEIGLDFSRILRSVLRHDPDIIMVGETRDPETAQIAVHAALTGHLLLTTLHTDTAAGAVARLLEMGVEPYLLASVLRAALGQRLVGVLCPQCRAPVAPRPEDRELFRLVGLTLPEDAVLWREVGCRACNQLGFIGRTGIFELFEVDEAVRAKIRERAPTRELLAAAGLSPQSTMLRHGLEKCLAGLTTLAEVRRATEA
jgi:general secretion pathway protein E